MPQAVSAATIEIQMTATGFAPANVTIQQGDSITFINMDRLPHWPASDVHPTHSLYPGSDTRKCDTFQKRFLFDSCGNVDPEGSYTFTFHTKGNWTFHDHLFPQYIGQVRVQAVEGYEAPQEYITALQFAKIPEQIASIPDFFLRQIARLGNWLTGKKSPEPLYGPYGAGDLVTYKNYELESATATTADDLETMRMINQIGLARTLEKIVEEAKGQPDTLCHLPAHVVGRAAFDLVGVKVFEGCDLSCHSGCYHGALEKLAASSDPLELFDQARALCSARETVFDRYQCFHGIGHGFMLFSHYKLDEALDACRTLGTNPARDACYGGVFMENLAGDGSIVGATVRRVSDTDLHYPCSALGNDPTAQQWCYDLQGGRFLFVNQNDFAAASKECLNAPASMQATCFKSLGRSSASGNLDTPQVTEQFCSTVPSAYYDECIVGGSKLAIDFPGPDPDGGAVRFCKGLSSSVAKKVCYDRYTQSLNEMLSSREERLAVCAMFESPYDTSCKAEQQ